MADKKNILIGIAVVLLVMIAALFAFNAGGNDGANANANAAPTPGTLSLSPDRGPDGTTSTVAVKGVTTGSAVSLTFSDNTPQATLAVDGNGDGSMSQVFAGRAGDRITVTATVTRPDSTTYQLAPVTFTITDPHGAVPVTVTLSPTEGPSGTQVLITVSGEANQAVTVSIGGNSSRNFPNTDAAGTSSGTQELVGQPGTTVTVTAQVGAGTSAPTGSAVFTFTQPTPPQPTVTVSISPDEGPSGTRATISVSGPANQPVTIRIGGNAATNGRTDAQGNYTLPHTFVGTAGTSIEVEAQVGSGGTSDPKGSASFLVTQPASLEGGPHTFIGMTSIMRDPGGHGPFVALLELLKLFVTVNSITIEGEAPFVAVTGDIAEDGTFSVEGQGTVAGFPDVQVRFDGRLEGTTLEGEYTMGTGGELPGGEPITYSISAELEAPAESDTAAEDPTEDTSAGLPDFAAFYASFNDAQAREDWNFLFAALHPAVLERYGSDTCLAYLEGIVNPNVTINFLQGRGPQSWDYVTDEISTTIDAAYAVDVEIVVGDNDPSPQETHLAVRDDGEIAWFSDCGEPQVG